MTDFTPALGLELIDFNEPAWHDKAWDNYRILDAACALIGITISGIWSNSTAVSVDEFYVDSTTGLVWRVLVAHTTAASPTTFAADRAANPTYWSGTTDLGNWQGMWQASTGYAVGDIVYNGSIYYRCNTAHTSGGSFSDTNWDTLADFSVALDAATASASAASTSESNAATSESNAASSATTASTAASNASTSESNASASASTASSAASAASTDAAAAATSASNASTSASNAATSEANAAASAAAAKSVLTAVVATTGDITLSGTQTIDGIAVVADDIVLVRDQAAPLENGVYVVAAGAWSRSTEANTWDKLRGTLVAVEQGTLTNNTIWLCTIDGGGTLETTAVTWGRLGLMEYETINANVMESIRVMNEYIRYHVDTGSINFQLEKAASGDLARFTGTMAGSPRWAMDFGDSTAESGSDAGSNFVIKAYDDSGSLIGNVLRHRRSDRQTLIYGQLVIDTGQNFAISGACQIHSGSSNPEGAVSAPAGSLYMRTNGTMYRKASGSGNTGWTTLS